MNRYTYLTLTVLFSLSLLAAQQTKELVALPAAKHIIVISSDKQLLNLDLIWVEESGLIQSKLVDHSAAGSSEKSPIRINLESAQIEELTALLLLTTNKNSDSLKGHVRLLAGIPESSMTDGTAQDLSEAQIARSIEVINRLYSNARMVQLKILYPYLKEALISLITHPEMIKAFIHKPGFLRDLQLHDDLVREKGIGVLSLDDQQFIRSQLYEDIDVYGSPTSLSISPHGEYIITAGAQGTRGFFGVLHVGQVKQFKKVELEDPIEQVLWISDTEIIIRTKSSCTLWNVQTDSDVTPVWLQEKLKDVSRLWAVVCSKDLSHIALGADDNVMLVQMQKRTTKVLSVPTAEKKEKSHKKKNDSKLTFVGNDKLLVEMKPTGDLLFYSVDNGICVSHEKGDGTEFQHYYVNGSSLITISAGNEARIWDCQRDAQKRVKNQGSLNHTMRFVSFGQQVTVVSEQELSMYDTRGSKFIEDMPFLAGTGVADVLMVKKDGSFVLRTGNGVSLTLPILDVPKYLCTSIDGSYLFGIGAKDNLRLWHYFNHDIKEYLSSRMTLAQGLCVKVMVNWIRSHLGSKKIVSFEHSCLRQPHLLELFNSLDETLRILIIYAFPEMCPPDEERGSSSTSVLSGSQNSPSLARKSGKSGKFFSLRRTISNKQFDTTKSDSPRTTKLERRNTNSGTTTLSSLSQSQPLKSASTDSPKNSPRAGNQRSETSGRSSPRADSPRKLADNWQEDSEFPGKSSERRGSEDLAERPLKSSGDGKASPSLGLEKSSSRQRVSSKLGSSGDGKGLSPLASERRSSHRQKSPTRLASSDDNQQEASSTPRSPRLDSVTPLAVQEIIQITGIEDLETGQFSLARHDSDAPQEGTVQSDLPQSSSSSLAKSPKRKKRLQPQPAQTDSEWSTLRTEKYLAQQHVTSVNDGEQAKSPVGGNRPVPPVNLRTSLRKATSVAEGRQVTFALDLESAGTGKYSPRRVSLKEELDSEKTLGVKEGARNSPRSRSYSVADTREASTSQALAARELSPRPVLRQEFVVTQNMDTFREISLADTIECDKVEFFEIIPPSCETLYQEGINFYKAGAFLKAFSRFTQVNSQMDNKKLQALSSYWLGEVCLHGWGAPCDYEMARIHFLTASKQDFDPSIKAASFERLGEIFYYGQKVARSQTKAQDYFTRSLRSAPLRSKISALFLLRRMLLKFSSIENTLTTQYLADLCELVNQEKHQFESQADAYFALLYQGRLELNKENQNGDFTKASTCFLTVAEKCTEVSLQAEAYYRLAKLYFGNPQFLSQSKSYFEKAAEQDVNLWVKAIAQVFLGHLAREGTRTGNISAAKEALGFYEKALHQTLNMSAKAEAAYGIARLFEKGDWDLKIDYDKVFQYDKEAAEQEYSEPIRFKALFSLGMQHYNGTPRVSLNLTQALKYFNEIEATCQDQVLLEEVWLRCAEMHRTGLGGIKKNPKLAVDYYKKIQASAKNQKYLQQALLRIGEEALNRQDYREAQNYLSRAQTLNADPEIQRQAKLLYAQIEEIKVGSDPHE